MRLVLIAIATAWAAGALIAFVRLREKPLDAKLTAGYLILWPAALVMVYISQPVPLWVSLPVMFGFIPWFLAGPHLWAVVKDPSRSRPDEVIGIPIGYWKWGGLAAVLLGIAFDALVRP